jgi:hypothetical protein
MSGERGPADNGLGLIIGAVAMSVLVAAASVWAQVVHTDPVPAENII